MSEKRDTRNILAKNFKALLSKNNIEKITIKDITDLSGVIRPTFYNYFKDKYDILEYVIWSELLLPIKPLLINDMVAEGVTLLFSAMKNDKEFYHMAMKIEGQNSFESIAREQVTKLLMEVIEAKNDMTHMKYKWLSTEVIAKYYAQSMVYVAIEWLKTGMMVTPKELSDIYSYLTVHSMMDVIGDFS